MLFKSKFITLTFTDSAIKAVSARPTAKGFKIYALAKKNLPPSTVFNGTIINTDLFRDSLKSFFLENFNRLKTRDLILGLNEQEVFLAGVSFDKKPSNLSAAVKEKITPRLPFDSKIAAITYREMSSNVYQVAVTKSDTLRLVSSIFRDVGFNVKAIVPIPLVFPKLVGKQTTPYLFVSSEEDLIYALIIKNTVIFSSTTRINNRVVDSEKEIVATAREIIQAEYERVSQELLKTIFVYGKSTEFLKSFFSNQKFDTQILASAQDTSSKIGYDLGDFANTIALSHYDSSVLAFPKLDTSKAVTIARQSNKKSRPVFVYFIILLLVVLAFSTFLLWPKVKETLNRPGQQTKTLPVKVATESSPKKPKEATSSTNKKGASPSAQPTPAINKKDFTVQVLNGSGTAGAAGIARDFLVTKGYNVVNVGNAANFNFKTAQVQIKNSKNQISNLLTKDLQERYAINIGSPLGEENQYDIIITLGGE